MCYAVSDIGCSEHHEFVGFGFLTVACQFEEPGLALIDDVGEERRFWMIFQVLCTRSVCHHRMSDVFAEQDAADQSLKLLFLKIPADHRPLPSRFFHRLEAHQQHVQQELELLERDTEARLDETRGEQVRLLLVDLLDQR